MKSNPKLKELALEVWKGRIFTSLDVPDGMNIGLVFSPLMFMDKEQLDTLRTKACLLYEYLSEAGPASINGCPVFFTVKILNEEDTKTLLGYLIKIRDKMKEI